MSYVQTGACPHCGEPIYTESPYFSILPPPTIYSCACRPAPQVTIITSTDGTTITTRRKPRPKGWKVG